MKRALRLLREQLLPNAIRERSFGRSNVADLGGVRFGGYRNAVGAVLVALLLVAAGSGGLIVFGSEEVSAQGPSSGEPRLEVFTPDAVLAPGETSELNIQIANDGRVSSGTPPELRETLTTARNVRVDVDDDGTPLNVRSGQQSVGTITENEPRNLPIVVEVPNDVDPGEYELEVELRYRHNAQINQGVVTNDRSRTVTRTITVDVDDGPRFALRNAETDAQVGDSGPMTVELENVGNERATDLSVALESSSARLSFGESPGESAAVGQLDPGETTTLEYDLTFGPRAALREYPLDATVTFEDADGLEGIDDRPTVNVTPNAKQSFAIDDVESTLRVGEDGDLRGTVTNTGPTTARSVVVQFAHESPNVIPIESDVAVGTLEPGESASFRLPIEINREAEAVPKAFDLAVQYRNADNELRRYGDVDAVADVAERRDEFLLSIPNREIQAGDSVLFDVEVTNNLDQTVTDLEAKLFTSSPLDSDEDEGYVEVLEPGETTTITFELSADSGAIPKTYPVSMDFRYDDERGTSTVSDTYRTAITVTEADDDGIPWALVGAVVVVVLLVAAFLYWRRSE